MTTTAATATATTPTPEVGRGRTLPTSQTAHVFATVLTGLSAGFFFAYESSVTRGLAEVDDLTYVQTFQAINATIKNPMFGTVFFGSLPALVLTGLLDCGATVRGVDLGQPLDDATVAEVRSAWLEHHVLSFPDQVMSDDDLERFTLAFGPFGDDPYEGQMAIHSARGGYAPDGFYGDDDQANGRSMAIRPSTEAMATQLHPIIREHPETGRLGIFSCLGYIIGIDGMADDVARPLLGELYGHQSQEAFVYRHVWEPNMLVMWDNRSVLHRATGGYDGHHRLLHRTTIGAI